jgi:hypothetical protein
VLIWCVATLRADIAARSDVFSISRHRGDSSFFICGGTVDVRAVQKHCVLLHDWASMRTKHSQPMLVAVVVVVAARTVAAAATAPCRDRLKQPFAASSIWNTAIGSGAVLLDANLYAPPPGPPSPPPADSCAVGRADPSKRTGCSGWQPAWKSDDCLKVRCVATRCVGFECLLQGLCGAPLRWSCTLTMPSADSARPWTLQITKEPGCVILYTLTRHRPTHEGQMLLRVYVLSKALLSRFAHRSIA